MKFFTSEYIGTTAKRCLALLFPPYPYGIFYTVISTISSRACALNPARLIKRTIVVGIQNRTKTNYRRHYKMATIILSACHQSMSKTVPKRSKLGIKNVQNVSSRNENMSNLFLVGLISSPFRF